MRRLLHPRPPATGKPREAGAGGARRPHRLPTLSSAETAAAAKLTVAAPPIAPGPPPLALQLPPQQLHDPVASCRSEAQPGSAPKKWLRVTLLGLELARPRASNATLDGCFWPVEGTT